jgi:hypothetical protein
MTRSENDGPAMKNDAFRYWFSMVLIGLISFVATLVLVRPEAPESRSEAGKRTTIAASISDPEQSVERAMLLREGGYTTMQVAARLEETLAQCGIADGPSERQRAEEIVLAVSREYQLRPMTILSSMDCGSKFAGMTGLIVAARRAADGLASRR